MKTYCVKTQDILPRRWTPFDLQSHELLTINLSLEILFVDANPIRQRYFPYSRRKHEILNNLYVWQYILISRYAFNPPLFNPFFMVFWLSALYQIYSPPELVQSKIIVAVVVQSVIKLCSTLCDPMDCSIPGFPVLHCLPEFTQIHVYWVTDTI